MVDTKHIAALALAAIDQELPQGSRPFVVVPEDFDIKDVEEKLAAPTRKRGLVTVADAASFVAYYNWHEEDGTVYAHADDKQPAFLGVMNDHGDAPGWGDHRVQFNCKLAKEWNTWLGKDGKHLPQKDFAKHIRDSFDDIVSTAPDEPSGAQMLEIALSLQAHKSVHYASAVRLNNGEVQIAYHESINGQAGAKGQMQIPEKFYIAVPVFDGGPAYKVQARLVYNVDGGAMSIGYELVRPDRAFKQAFDDLVQEIADGTKATVIRGWPGGSRA